MNEIAAAESLERGTVIVVRVGRGKVRGRVSMIERQDGGSIKLAIERGPREAAEIVVMQPRCMVAVLRRPNPRPLLQGMCARCGRPHCGV